MDREPDVTELLVHASHALRRQWMTSLEPWNVSPHEFRALRAAADLAPARLSDLADRLRIANRSVTEVVDSLEAKGLARRAPSPTDRRAVVVNLTDEGERMMTELATSRSAAGAAFLEPLDARERETLRALLTRLIGDEPPRHR